MNTWNQRHNWIPLVFLVLGLLLVLQLGIAGRNNDAERISLETRITAEQIKLRLESCFDTRAGLVRALAGYPWQSEEQIVDGWSGRASALMPLYTGVQALNYVNTDGVIRVIYPVEPNRAALNANLRQNPNASVVSALERAGVSDAMARTEIVELLQGGKGFALYQPIRAVDGQPIGFANGVFRVGALMNSCLPEGRFRRDFAFSLIDSDSVFFEQADSLAIDPSPYQVDLEIDVTGSPWHFSVAPMTSYLEATDDILDEAWIGVGILFTTLLALALRYALLKQRDIKRREDDYRLLVENQTDLVVKVNMAGEFQYISPSYCEMFGKSEDELLGKAFMPLVHEDDRELTARSLERLPYPPHTAYHEQRAMTKDGWRWLAWSNRAVLDNNGEMVGITAVGRDVTDVKRLEERIAHSQKMRAMGELAGGITHDFNNLLQVILGNIEFLLLDEKHDAETREALESVRDVGTRAMGLTKKLATLSRQEMTRPEMFDINQFLSELEKLLGHTLPASVDLAVTPAEDSLPVNGDRSQIEQVLLNLCFNARDAVESKGHIRLKAERQMIDGLGPGPDPQLSAGEYVVITVEDDGHGIEPENLPRVFDPFFTTKGTDMGTGLGLANSYSIIERHDGTITVDSAKGEGSVFTVYLPLATADAGETEADSGAAEPEQTASASSSELVLVADDNEQLRELAIRILEKAGYEVCTAADGKEALELYKARRNEIRLLILDLIMPEMTGQEVAAAVREISSDVPILFVSGYVPEDTLRELNEPIIRKPYSISDLMEALGDLV
ncbi:MAG: ATP-binding protein [Woeseiaceae bacterium]|nr:ATP-binding protein [Woeseiaceae bacterium]